MTAEPLALVDSFVAVAKAEILDKWTSYCELTHELLTFRRKAAATPEQSARSYLARDPDSNVEKQTEINEADGWQRFADAVAGRLSVHPAPRAAKIRREAQALEKEFCDRFVAIGRLPGRITIKGTDGLTGQSVTCSAELFAISSLSFDLKRNKITRDPAPEIIGACVVLAEPQPIAPRATDAPLVDRL